MSLKYELIALEIETNTSSVFYDHHSGRDSGPAGRALCLKDVWPEGLQFDPPSGGQVVWG